MSPKKALLAIFSFLMIQPVLPEDFQSKTHEILSTLEQLAITCKVPDYSVVIVRHDSILLQMNRQPENQSKNYLIGSCSKSFTALAALKLINDGKIAIDAPVKNYLPWFEMKNPEYSEKVTVRQLLNQTSGFERQYGFFDTKIQDQASYELELANYIRKIDVRFIPGSTFLYSNLNYVLLGLIVQHASNLTYEAYLNKEILPAAGMNQTYFTQSKAVENNLIQPYHYMFWGLPVRSRVYYYSDYLVPAGYISSNAQDIAAYMQFMLNKAVSVSGDTILSESLFRELTGLDKEGYAMGWFHSTGDSISMVSHSGLDENFSSAFTFFPEKDLGFAILCNSNSLEFCGLANAALRGIIFDKPFALKGNMEKKMRTFSFFIPFLLLTGFILNLRRWKKHGYRIGLTRKALPILRWVIGVMLSAIPLILLSKMFQLHVKDMIRFSPDIAWGLILILLIGLFSATVRYFGTVAGIQASLRSSLNQ